MSNPSSTKVHARIDHDRALCGLTPRNGHAGAIKAFAEFFAAADEDQCGKCLEGIRKRGYNVATLRRRYRKAEPVSVDRPAGEPALFDVVKRTAMALFDKTIATIERSQIDIRRFERMCETLRARGFEFDYKVTPHPYAIGYSVKLNQTQARRLSELLAELACLGYENHDPAFPNISGMRALEISRPDAPAFTLNYVRQGAPSLGALSRHLANHQLEELRHANAIEN